MRTNFHSDIHTLNEAPQFLQIALLRMIPGLGMLHNRRLYTPESSRRPAEI